MDVVPNTFPALCIAYGCIWVILIAYLFSLAKRVSILEQTISDSKKERDS